MTISRRGFLKGLGAIAAGAYAPSLVKAATVEPEVAKVVKPLPEPARRMIASAWVRFDGTDTVKIHGAHNVSDVIQTDPGCYTIKFDGVLGGQAKIRTPEVHFNGKGRVVIVEEKTGEDPIIGKDEGGFIHVMRFGGRE